MSTMPEVKQFLVNHGVRTVIVLGTDPTGVARGKRLNVDFFLKAAESGIGFSSYIMGTTTMDEVLPGLAAGSGQPARWGEGVRGLPAPQGRRAGLRLPGAALVARGGAGRRAAA